MLFPFWGCHLSESHSLESTSDGPEKNNLKLQMADTRATYDAQLSQKYEYRPSFVAHMERKDLF